MVAEAKASKNISALVDIITNSGALTDADYIDKSLGRIRVMYYMFLDNMHTRPRDLIDMVDGILYIECKQHFQEKELNKIKQEQASRGKH